MSRGRTRQRLLACFNGKGSSRKRPADSELFTTRLARVTAPAGSGVRAKHTFPQTLTGGSVPPGTAEPFPTRRSSKAGGGGSFSPTSSRLSAQRSYDVEADAHGGAMGPSSHRQSSRWDVPRLPFLRKRSSFESQSTGAELLPEEGEEEEGPQGLRPRSAFSNSGREHGAPAGVPTGVVGHGARRGSGGRSFQRKDLRLGRIEGIEAWEEVDATTFPVRGPDYPQTRRKMASPPALYRLIGCDIFSFGAKIGHIARHLALPDPPPLGPGAAALPPGDRIPALLVVNVQLPTYAPSLFGKTDGPGHSLVFYYALPAGWEPPQPQPEPQPEQQPQPEPQAEQEQGGAGASPRAGAGAGPGAGAGAALGLWQRLVHDGPGADGRPVRERLKLLARCANVAEWAQEAALNGIEQRLVANYNGKPVLTRPQHRFFQGEGYFEIDIDVHQWAFVARKGLHSYLPKLRSIVFEIGLVVQGNAEEELPEQVLAAARITRLDFSRVRPFPARLTHSPSGQSHLLRRLTSRGRPRPGPTIPEGKVAAATTLTPEPLANPAPNPSSSAR